MMGGTGAPFGLTGAPREPPHRADGDLAGPERRHRAGHRPRHTGGPGGAGGGVGGAGAGPVPIGLSLDTLKEARWQADRDLIVARAAELGGEVRVQSANGDDTRQVNDVLSLLSGKVRVLMIVPHDG